jgi:hypothetical protein
MSYSRHQPYGLAAASKKIKLSDWHSAPSEAVPIFDTEWFAPSPQRLLETDLIFYTVSFVPSLEPLPATDRSMATQPSHHVY